MSRKQPNPPPPIGKRGFIIEVELNGLMYYQSRDLSAYVDDPLKAERFATKREARDNCSSGYEKIKAI
jgi:hypothetical protein